MFLTKNGVRGSKIFIVAILSKGENMTTKKIVHLGLFAALGVMLLMLEFPILSAAPYLKLNFSDLPALIAGFMYGWWAGIIVTVVKVGIFMLTGLSASGPIGDLANVIIGIVFAVTAALIYSRMKTLKGAIVSLSIASVAMVLAACLSNWFILMPSYGIPSDAIPSLILTTSLPFNAIKAVGTSILTFFVYKPIKKGLM